MAGSYLHNLAQQLLGFVFLAQLCVSKCLQVEVARVIGIKLGRDFKLSESFLGSAHLA